MDECRTPPSGIPALIEHPELLTWCSQCKATERCTCTTRTGRPTRSHEPRKRRAAWLGLVRHAR